MIVDIIEMALLSRGSFSMVMPTTMPTMMMGQGERVDVLPSPGYIFHGT